MPDRHTGKDPQTEHLSDHGLLALVARGDREAFARLYDQYSEAAYSLAVRIVRDRDLAADVVQDAFLAVWKQASRFDARRGQPSTWILTLTHHKAVDIVRREDGSWLIDGGVSIDRFREALGIEEPLPEEDTGSYNTLAGFVMLRLGRVPQITDRFEWNGLRFEVVDMDRNRVDKLLVGRLPEAAPVSLP